MNAYAHFGDLTNHKEPLEEGEDFPNFAEYWGENSPYTYGPYGVMVLHEGVCASFASSLVQLCNYTGKIKAQEVSGWLVLDNANTYPGHAWNQVDFGEGWKNVDITFHNVHQKGKSYYEYDDIEFLQEHRFSSANLENGENFQINPGILCSESTKIDPKDIIDLTKDAMIDTSDMIESKSSLEAESKSTEDLYK